MSGTRWEGGAGAWIASSFALPPAPDRVERPMGHFIVTDILIVDTRHLRERHVRDAPTETRVPHGDMRRGPSGFRHRAHLRCEGRVALLQLRGPLARRGERRIVEPCRREHPDEGLYKLLGPRLDLPLEFIARQVIAA